MQEVMDTPGSSIGNVIDATKNDNGGEGKTNGASASFEGKAVVASPILNGEAEVAVEEDGLSIASLFDALTLHWADVTQIDCSNHMVSIQTNTALYTFSKMGQDAKPFFCAALAAYSRKVRKAFFAEGDPVLATTSGGTTIEVFSDSVLRLPPNLAARRVPLAFVTSFNDDNQTVRMGVMDGSSYTFAKMGYDTEPFSRCVQDAIRGLREKSRDAIAELDPSLSGEQVAALVRLLPYGAAAPVSRLRAVAPSFVAALEEQIAQSRVAQSYEAFKAMSNPDAICIGFKKNESRAENTESASPYTLWMIVPAPHKQACAVEFAGEDSDAAATFVYRYEQPWEEFALKLNMALEAIHFKRQIIALSDEDLALVEHTDARMAVQRNDSLQMVRSSFVGRAIHSSEQAWKEKVSELWG